MCEISKWILLGFLIVFSISDFKWRGVRTWMLVMMSVVVLLFGIFVTEEPIWSILGGVIVGVLFLGISYGTKESIGYADSWLILILGVYLGIRDTLLMLTVAFFFAGLVSLVGIAVKRWKRNGTIAFIPFLTMAYIGVILI